MSHFLSHTEDGEDTNYWNPVSSIIASAAVILLLVLVAVGMAMKEDTVTVSQNTVQATPINTETEAALKAREADLEIKENALADKEAALIELAGIRAEIIEELTEKLSELKLPIEINNATGNIRFTESVLFDVNNDKLNAEGQQYLKTFMPVYLSVLLSSKNEKYLDQIIIEGHADIDGSYWFNLSLSQDRANSVVDYIMAQHLTKMPNNVSADKYFTVSGRSHNVPVLVDGVPDRNQSRRVEFVFRLKEDALLQKMQDIYKGEE